MEQQSRQEVAQVDQLIELFDRLFADRYQTRLVRGDEEPLYQPASKACVYHRIIFAHGYFASALHEISHWCIAGAKRRQLEDYGYWYMPDGRDEDAQRAFERAETAPQAIEKQLTLACRRRFNVSVDNLDGSAEVDRDAFADRVEAKRQAWLSKGFPRRARAFNATLEAFFGEGESIGNACCRGARLLD